MSDDGARQPWERRAGESPRGYEAFRRFRDAGPLRRIEDLIDEPASIRLTTLHEWSRRNDWKDRALAWDDETHRAEDARRLEAIRTMHDVHARAGRVAMGKALTALQRLTPAEIPAYAAARLLELGARLERDTLIVSVEQLQGIPPATVEDPWEAIARELEGHPGAPG